MKILKMLLSYGLLLGLSAACAAQDIRAVGIQPAAPLPQATTVPVPTPIPPDPGVGQPPPASSSAQQPAQPTVVQMLEDPTIWGKDYPAALAYLSSWKSIEEQSVALFADEVVGATVYDSRDRAEQSASQLSKAMQEPQPPPNREFETFIGDAGKTPPPFQAAPIPFPEDDSIRVAWTGESLQFLAPGLRLAEIEARYGPPEKVERQAIQGEGERRPIILITYQYADGAILFAETDIAPIPGLVNRVLFDVDAITRVVFQP